MKKKYGMVVDVDKCTGCYACFLACKDENCGEEFPGYTAAQPMTGQFWINLTEVERGTFPKIKLSHIPKLCAHCDKPGCMQMAENGAVYKRDDGIVIVDPVKAVGQKQIVNTCPHRVIFWNEEKQLPQKCDLCAHFLDQGFANPRCVEMCPTSALVFGDLNDPDSEVARLVAEKNPSSSHPEFGLKENVLYLNIPKKFVAGTVVIKETDRCAKDVEVVLKGNGVERRVETDVFGDFWFDGLENRTEYTLDIEAPGYKKISLVPDTLSDVNLGEIFLETEAEH
ncbi:MAG: oxidoreductase [Candidatus Accumulibacter sp.]|jgi:Fe-S-cluster-containing dehydrogenase component|nr:oxidoreductase [Accumulibacter sp.]